MVGVHGVAPDVVSQWVEPTSDVQMVELGAEDVPAAEPDAFGGTETFRAVQWAPDAVHAVEPLRHSVAVASQAKDAPQWRAARSQNTLGVALAALGQYPEAEELLIGSYRVLFRELGADDALTRTAHQRALDFLRARGRSHEAPQLLAVN